ncbi:universal stress protein [bacterium]|nr:MAG: universal stress protein [bacterium]
MERESKVKELIVENSLVADVVIIRDADIVKTVVDEFRKVDLIPMGGSTGEFLELLFGRSVSQEITEQAACPVLWVKEYEEREPLWKLLLKSPKKIGV